MKRKVGLAVLALLSALGGCRALPALHYYALDAANPGTASPPGAVGLIHVRHIGLPHEMDHLGLTHHLGPTQLAISDYDQWTAPLSVLIQGTMTRDLGARLGFEHLIAADAVPAGLTQTALDLDFVSLSADETCGISAQVRWTASTPGQGLRQGSIALAAPAAGCPAGLPAALSAALGMLADQLIGPLSAP